MGIVEYNHYTYEIVTKLTFLGDVSLPVLNFGGDSEYYQCTPVYIYARFS